MSIMPIQHWHVNNLMNKREDTLRVGDILYTTVGQYCVIEADGIRATVQNIITNKLCKEHVSDILAQTYYIDRD